MKTLSIIIPHHNQPHLLRILLDSIVIDEQTEVLVIDDNSDQRLDDYHRLTQEPAYQSVRFISGSPDQRGPGHARNLGIEKATGTYLMFCDADDYLLSGYAAILKPYLNSGVDLVYFKPISRILGTDQKADRADLMAGKIMAYLEHPDQTTEDVLRFNCFSTWSRLYRRTLIESAQIRYGNQKVSEDVPFAIAAGLAAKTLTACSETIYCVTSSPSSLFRTMTKEYYEIRFNIIVDAHATVRKAIGVKRYRNVEMPAMVYVKYAFTYGLGLKTALSTIWTLKRHGIKLLSSRHLNPKRFMATLKQIGKSRVKS